MLILNKNNEHNKAKEFTLKHHKHGHQLQRSETMPLEAHASWEAKEVKGERSLVQVRESPELKLVVTIPRDNNQGSRSFTHIIKHPAKFGLDMEEDFNVKKTVFFDQEKQNICYFTLDEKGFPAKLHRLKLESLKISKEGTATALLESLDDLPKIKSSSIEVIELSEVVRKAVKSSLDKLGHEGIPFVSKSLIAVPHDEEVVSTKPFEQPEFQDP